MIAPLLTNIMVKTICNKTTEYEYHYSISYPDIDQYKARNSLTCLTIWFYDTTIVNK